MTTNTFQSAAEQSLCKLSCQSDLYSRINRTNKNTYIFVY